MIAGHHRPTPVSASTPAPDPAHVGFIASGIVRALRVKVGGRGADEVRIAIAGAHDGDTVEVRLVDGPRGVEATLSGDDPTHCARLAGAIARALQARGVAVSEVEVGG